ncbi:MAG: nucleotidyltransferase domain-containing protein [Microcystaceae cyanobacterium]
MNYSSLDKLQSLSCQIPSKIPYLKMLVLFGSQATGKSHSESDWDFAVLCDEAFKGDRCKEL